MKKREFIQFLEKELDENDSVFTALKDEYDDVYITPVTCLGFYYKRLTEDHFDNVSQERVAVLEYRAIVDGYIRESEKPLYEKRWKISQQFPKDKKNWSIEQSYSNSIQVKFKFAGFAYQFTLGVLMSEYHIMHFGKDMNNVPFTTWDDFFEQAKPIVLKSLQKYREELECFESDSI